MSAPLFSRSAAQIAIREGRNATDALRLFRAAGGTVRTSTWYRLYGQAQLEGVMASGELERPINRIPEADTIQTMTTKRATGFLQRVVVMSRDPDGLVVSKHVSLRTDNLISRQAAIQHAQALISDNEDTYGLSPIGAFYGGTYELEPE